MMGAWLAAALLASAAAAHADSRPIAVSTTLVVKVTDKVAAADTSIAECEALGGYFSRRDNDHVVLRVPTLSAKALQERLEELGVVIQREHAARDVGQKLQEKKTLLASRQEVFSRYFAVLATASISNVVEVESEMTRLVQEIEELQGQIQLLEHQLRYATLTMRFQFRDRRPPAKTGNSSFAWINTMNLADLLEDFSHAP